METQDLIKQYINQKNVMQLATTNGSQPYIINLHFYADDDLNLYWISTEARRHSQEIAQNPKVSSVVLVHENTPGEDYVIGLTIVGKAQLLGQAIGRPIAESYVNKLGKSSALVDEIASGKNPHRFYKLTPATFILFDSKNFPTDPRREWSPGA